MPPPKTGEKVKERSSKDKSRSKDKDTDKDKAKTHKLSLKGSARLVAEFVGYPFPPLPLHFQGDMECEGLGGWEVGDWRLGAGGRKLRVLEARDSEVKWLGMPIGIGIGNG